MAFSISLPAKRNLQSPCNVRFGGLRLGGWVVVVVSVLLATAVAPASSRPQVVTYRPEDVKGTSGGKFVIPCEYLELVILLN